MERSHIPQVVSLQRRCFPAPFPEGLLWTTNHLEAHLSTFADGQFVALIDGRVVGSSSSLSLSEGAWQAHTDWEATCGGFQFSGHDPTGSTLYGADISVDPVHQGQGVGKRLYRARFQLVRRLGLCRFGTTCRMPGWEEWSQSHPNGTPAGYCQEVVSGAVTDRTMTPLLRMGLNFIDVVEQHMDDPESGNSAAVLEWVP